MAKVRKNKKAPSRMRYEQRHPTRSCRLNIEEDELLEEHLEGTLRSFADFVKDHLREEETMVKERVEILASKKVKETKTRPPDLELYPTILNLIHWVTLLWVNLTNLMEIPCPDCLFPPKLTKKQPRTVMMQMLESGDFRCPQCGLTLKNPPQLAWTILVRTVADEVRRKKLLQSKEEEPDGEGNFVHDSAHRAE